MTGPSTPPPRGARARTSSAGRPPWASGTRPASPWTAALRTLRVAARPRSSTTASQCWLPWVTSPRRSQASCR
eukprot:7002349-Heterocapsa_arctica.AAC.1